MALLHRLVTKEVFAGAVGDAIVLAAGERPAIFILVVTLSQEESASPTKLVTIRLTRAFDGDLTGLANFVCFFKMETVREFGASGDT